MKKFFKENVPEGRFKQVLRTINEEYFVKSSFLKNKISYDRKNNIYSLELNTNIPRTTLLLPKKLKTILSSSFTELTGYFSIPFEDNAVIVDAGAYPGDYAVVAAHHAKNARILSLEPNKENRAFTKETIQLNGLEGQIELLGYALSKEEKEVDMVGEKHEAHILTQKEEHNYTSQRIKTITLDKLLGERNLLNGRPIYVKMDIEGAEIEAYEGARETIKHGAVFNIACYHELPNGEITGSKLLHLFRAEGYDARIINKTHPTLVAQVQK